VTITAPSNGVEQQALSAVTVKVQDAISLAPLPAESVTITYAGGPGTLQGTTSGTTDSSGNATFSGLSFTKAGSYTLTGTSGNASATSAPIAVDDCTVASPCSVSFSASPADAVNGQTLASDRFGNDGSVNPVQVTVKDAAGYPITGRSVSVALSPNAASLGGTKSATTNSNGTASFSNLTVATSTTGYTLKGTYVATSNASFSGVSAAFGIFDGGDACLATQTCDVTVTNSNTGTTVEGSFLSQGNSGLGISIQPGVITDAQWNANCGGFNLAALAAFGQPLGVSGNNGFVQWTTKIDKNIRINSPAGVSSYRQCYARPAIDGPFATTRKGDGGVATGQSALITGSDGSRWYIGAPANCPATIVDACVKSISAKPSSQNSGVSEVIEIMVAPVRDPGLH
jgi:hypothetical protein